MTTPISRRAVLRGLAVGATSPVWLRYADVSASAATAASANTSRHLLVIFLRGGNDPLATVAPVGNAALLKMRPSVGLRDAEMFALGNGYGINKRLPTFFDLWKSGQLAIIQQVGPTVADFSHSIASRRWESGSPDDRFQNGWLGRYLDRTPSAGPVRAAAFGDSLPFSLVGEHADALSMQSLANFAFTDRRLPDAAARRAALAAIAGSPAPAGSLLATLLQSQREILTATEPLAKVAPPRFDGKATTNAASLGPLFAAGIGTEIGFLSIAHFDTHSNERAQHVEPISELDAVVNAFVQSAQSSGVLDNSMVLVVSEFGRRVYENRSAGTDHGLATTVFAMGPKVRGGMYGPSLDLSQLDDGNLPTRVDLRSVYATVLGGWLKTNPAPILGGEFATLPLFR